jgi:hypothetical protein
VFFDALQSAYTAALDGDVIQAKTGSGGVLVCDKAGSFTLQGGYDPAFSASDGYTILQGSLVVMKGRLNVERVVIKAQ